MIKNNKMKPIGRALSLLLCAVVVISLCAGAFSVAASARGDVEYGNLKLIPGGIPFGVKFSVEGVVVVGFSDIDEVDKSHNPAYIAGLRQKDVIIKVNGEGITGASQLTEAVESSGGQSISLTFRRGGAEKTINVTPIFSKSENKYKTGIWVRDSGAGIGTVTYIIPETLEFGGLGHGICDGETGELIPMSRGVVTDVNISSVKRGLSGEPGEIRGHFGIEKRGVLYKNTECGVYGVFSSLPEGVGEAMPIGKREDIRCGEASIICTLENGVKESFAVEITSINPDAKGSKCFMIKIKDDGLIDKSGGIVQGMSGSPVIQNGKLVGAVTHVMINDPCVGYGIFIENMLSAAQSQAQPKAA